MSDLSKQQLILLALLVSFVTSLATGIVTVSLMDQSPQGVTQTISQVIERTIQQVSPQNAAVATVSVNVEDKIADAVSKVSSEVVKIKDGNGVGLGGLGIVVSADGVIMTDKSVVTSPVRPIAIFSDGGQIPLLVVQMQATGDVVFLAPANPVTSSTTSYVPINFADSSRLGQTVLSLSRNSTNSTLILGQGIITQSDPAYSSLSPVNYISTSIPLNQTELGSPLFDLEGNIIGIRTVSSHSPADIGAAFYPVAQLKTTLPTR